MSPSGLFSRTDHFIESSLDGLSLRQRVTAHNIANVDTPGYKRYDVSFENELRLAIHRRKGSSIEGTLTHDRHIPVGSNKTSKNKQTDFVPRKQVDTTMRNDGNNVDIERETAQMIKDQLHYIALSVEAAKRYAMMKDAITGR